jgi:hypothetical protein
MTKKPQSYQLIVQEGLDLSGETDRELLIMLGEAIYGDNWRRALASDLGVSHGLVNKLIANPDHKMSQRVRDALHETARQAVFSLSLAHAIAVAVRDEIGKRRKGDRDE